MKKLESAFITVEATVIFPLLIFVTATFMYLLIYVYDNVLIRQDVNSLIAALRSSDGDFYYVYREITEEHVYISAQKPNIELIKNNSNYIITISCDWEFPLASNVVRNINASAEVKVLNPFKIMLYTEDISNMVSGGTNDSD